MNYFYSFTISGGCDWAAVARAAGKVTRDLDILASQKVPCPACYQLLEDRLSSHVDLRVWTMDEFRVCIFMFVIFIEGLYIFRTTRFETYLAIQNIKTEVNKNYNYWGAKMYCKLPIGKKDSIYNAFKTEVSEFQVKRWVEYLKAISFLPICHNINVIIFL